jgi:hypothetical protein
MSQQPQAPVETIDILAAVMHKSPPKMLTHLEGFSSLKIRESIEFTVTSKSDGINCSSPENNFDSNALFFGVPYRVEAERSGYRRGNNITTITLGAIACATRFCKTLYFIRIIGQVNLYFWQRCQTKFLLFCFLREGLLGIKQKNLRGKTKR